MKQHFIDNNSDTLLLFFTGWGCDEYEFEYIKSSTDVLILYDYTDLNFDFDFSKYKKFDLIAFSAGIFIASIMNFNFKINKKIAISGNPYLFDEYYGLSSKMQDLLYNITEETAEDFAKNYLVKTDEEWQNFHPSRRTLESCRTEFDSLKEIYNDNKNKIKDIYDFALFGEDDHIFNITAQKKFYKERTKIIKNSRHNIFSKIENFEQITNFLVS
ncbi:MAG: pimeloyl-ACP methyl esterase BioG family protein [Candidatus Gastranaerophilaceae bacterium]|nr:pimeloyl-ACP methyl esterase BioG family protein [Candidatus Gastranaerophilaceae bacterium]